MLRKVFLAVLYGLVQVEHRPGFIQTARVAHGITQTAFAERIDVSLRTIIAIETGKRNPTFEVLYKIIRELNIPADLIFRPDDVPGTPEQVQFIRKLRDAN